MLGGNEHEILLRRKLDRGLGGRRIRKTTAEIVGWTITAMQRIADRESKRANKRGIK